MKPKFTSSLSFAWRLIALGAAVTLLVRSADVPKEAPTSNVAAGHVASDPASTVAQGKPSAPTYAAIMERPLFHSTRRPWQPPPPAPPLAFQPAMPAPLPTTLPPSGYVLVGIVVNGDTRSALLRKQGVAKAISLVEGQMLDGWTLNTIASGHLHFGSGTETYDLAFPNLRQAGHAGPT